MVDHVIPGQTGALSHDDVVAVVFDLDGTLIDSGAIILASFQHATRTVLRREIPEAELAALVGGSSIYDQMRGIDELQAEELVRVYRAHNEPLHDQLETFEGIAKTGVESIKVTSTVCPNGETAGPAASNLSC